MSDPKVTPEFLRGWRAAAKACGDSGDYYTEKAEQWLEQHEPETDDLAAAEERLGRWLVANHCRSFIAHRGRRVGRPLEPDGTYWVCMLWLEYDPLDAPDHEGRAATKAAAISAALDAAGAP